MPDALRFKDAVDVITATFAVIVGFALNNFITKAKMFKEFNKSCAERAFRAILYCSSVLLVTSLALRFLIGSKVHLLITYTGTKQSTIGWFFHDLIFLIAFGVVLVRVPSAKNLLELVRWLMRFLALAVLWSLVTLLFGKDKSFAGFWIVVDLIQLSLSLVVFWFLRYKLKNEGRPPCHIWAWTGCVLAIIYVVMFFIDVRWIIQKDSQEPSDCVRLPCSRTISFLEKDHAH